MFSSRVVRSTVKATLLAVSTSRATVPLNAGVRVLLGQQVTARPPAWLKDKYPNQPLVQASKWRWYVGFSGETLWRYPFRPLETRDRYFML